MAKANKLTAKQEMFAHAWASSGNKTESYRQAYSTARMQAKTIENKAYALSKHGGVRARYEELTKAAQERNKTSVDTIDGMLKSAWSLAKKINKPSAMVSAAIALAKLHGLNQPEVIDHNLKGAEMSRMEKIQGLIDAEREGSATH